MILACAFLLVLVLYSPIGSPENYVQNSYYTKNQGVSFSGKIQNAPRGGFYISTKSSPSILANSSIESANVIEPNSNISLEGNSINVQPLEYNSEIKSIPSYAVAKRSGHISTAATATMQDATYSVASKSNVMQNEKNSGGSLGGSLGATIISQTKNENNTNPQLNEFIALNSIDLSIFSDLTPKQGGGYTPGSGATDPGEDPTEEPLPVPDGFWLLLFMAIGYAAFKYLKKEPQTV